MTEYQRQSLALRKEDADVRKAEDLADRAQRNQQMMMNLLMTGAMPKGVGEGPLVPAAADLLRDLIGKMPDMLKAVGGIGGIATPTVGPAGPSVTFNVGGGAAPTARSWGVNFANIRDPKIRAQCQRLRAKKATDAQIKAALDAEEARRKVSLY